VGAKRDGRSGGGLLGLCPAAGGAPAGQLGPVFAHALLRGGTAPDPVELARVHGELKALAPDGQPAQIWIAVCVCLSVVIPCPAGKTGQGRLSRRRPRPPCRRDEIAHERLSLPATAASMRIWWPELPYTPSATVNKVSLGAAARMEPSREAPSGVARHSRYARSWSADSQVS